MNINDSDKPIKKEILAEVSGEPSASLDIFGRRAFQRELPLLLAEKKDESSSDLMVVYGINSWIVFEVNKQRMLKDFDSPQKQN